MAKKFFGKRTIAVLLTLIMVFNLFSTGIYAAENTAPSMVQNLEDTYYKQDGTVGSASDWEIHLSKTAAPTAEDNIYNITLKVETKDTFTQTAGTTDGAAVLVLDVSNSMNSKEPGCAVDGCDEGKNAGIHCTKYEKGRKSWKDQCKECGETEAAHDAHHRYQASTKTQLDNLQAAVADFLNAFVADAATGEKRMVAVAVFGTDAVTIQDWVDVTNSTARSNLIDKIDSLSTGNGAYMGKTYLTNGGTNMEAGLVLGRNLLKDSEALTGISVTNQSLILFSDGEPTARVSNVDSTSTEKVTYGGNDTGSNTDYVDYDDISTILRDISAAKIAVKYNYDDNSGVLKAPPFTRVISSGASTLSVDLQAEAGKVITNKTNASTVTDPMGTGVSMISVTTGYNAATKKWDLSKYTPAVLNGITTYTITYQIEIDPEAVELDANYPGYTVLTPANGETTLNYTYGEAAIPVNADFNEPSIRGIRSFTVSYDYEGQVPAGVPDVPADKTYKAGEPVKVADAPSLENYIFSGWNQTDFVMPAEDVVIVGSWTEKVKYDYSLIYNANFGENETKADADNISGIYETDYNITVDENTFVRPDYIFVGWNTEADGSGMDFIPGEAVALTAQYNTEILYAQWIIEEEPPATEPPATEPPATEPPATEPPATEPPATEPPATEPPATEPPATEPPATEPPATEPPATEPPATEPPATEPPATEPPATEPPATEPPATEPPATEPPATEPPATEPPATEPPATEPPATEPPATEPPATEPPATEPPATEPPATEPPATEPPATEPPETEPEEDLDIPDEDVPLDPLPQTGSHVILPVALMALSGTGLICLKGKKKEEEE